MFFYEYITSRYSFMSDVIHRLPLEQRIRYRLAALVWQCLFGFAAAYTSPNCASSATRRQRMWLSIPSLVFVPFAVPLPHSIAPSRW